MSQVRKQQLPASLRRDLRQRCRRHDFRSRELEQRARAFEAGGNKDVGGGAPGETGLVDEREKLVAVAFAPIARIEPEQRRASRSLRIGQPRASDARHGAERLEPRAEHGGAG